MRTTTALARREDEPPGSLVRRLGARVREGIDAAVYKLGGEELRARMRLIQQRTPPGTTDPFGFDPEWAKYALATVQLLYRYWFRVRVTGIENVPSGRALLIANHSGQLPIDGALVAGALFFEGDPPRVARSMVEKWSQTLPGVSTFFSRCGQVVGVPENAERLLEMGEPLLVFPEGTRGISKPFTLRYRLQEFGLGFMRLALATKTPIVPIAVVGGEEQYINVGNLESVAKALRMPVFPIVPQWFIPGAQMPLPTKYHIYFGEPLHMTGDPDDEDAAIGDKVDVVRATVQSMVNRGLKERKSLFW